MRALLAILVLYALSAPAAFVYETPAEFLTTGDFNGDGRADALILDRLTGNARVGYQNADGALDWSPGVPTGVESATALAVGRFSQTNRESIAVTASRLNRIHVVSLAAPGSAPSPTVVNPTHAGVSLLVGLDAPLGVTEERSWLLAGSHDPGITLLDLLAFLAEDLATFQDQIAADGFLSSANAFRRSAGDATLVAAMRRGSNDTFVVYAYTNTAEPVLVRANLSVGTEYTFGRFNNEPYPRLMFYVPGQSNIIVQPLVLGAAGFEFGPPTVNVFAAPVERVFYLEEATNGLAVVHFGDGVVSGLRPSAGSGQLQLAYGLGLGAAGNEITGIIPLGVGKLALLWSSNSVFSAHAQILTRNAAGEYVQTSASTLPAVTSTGTRGNVWLFQTDPFTSSAATLISSLNAPVWSSAVIGLPGSVSVRVESDGGLSSGLGSPATNNFGVAPTGAGYALPNQYRDDISFFSYSPPRPVEPSLVTILPPPGLYTAPLQVSFHTQDPNDAVYYRAVAGDWWQLYTAPFVLTNDATVEYYGVDLNGLKSRTQLAGYSLGRTNTPPVDPAIVPDPSTNQVPPVLPGTLLSERGTIFYGRTDNTIWAIDLDGSGDSRVTSGSFPRVSRDGQYLLFKQPTNGLWLRELKTGLEVPLDAQSPAITGYDWERSNVEFVLDKDCYLISRDVAGNSTPLPLSDCNDDAPVVNPLDGSLAYHNLSPNTQVRGIYVTSPVRTSRTRLNLNLASPRWPSWSPGGGRLAVAAGNPAAPAESMYNLWLFEADGSDLRQITALAGNDRFDYGALWAPDESALVTAGTIWGTNGLWVLHLTPDGNYCGCAPIRLPTTPGAAVHFAGSIVTAPPSIPSVVQPGFFIRRESDRIVVYWGTVFSNFHLEYASELAPGAGWTPIPGPYETDGYFFYHYERLPDLAPGRLFRLRRP